MLIVYPKLNLIILIIRTQLILQQVALNILGLRNRDRQRDHEEGIKGNRNPLTECAFKRRLELSMKQIANDRLIPQQVLVPCLFAGDLIGLALRLGLLDVGLLLLLIQILGHEIENGIDTLLRIVLPVAFEGDVVLAEDSLEQIGPNNLRVIDPHLTNELGPSLHQPAFRPQRILILPVDQTSIPFLQEIFG